MVGKVIILEAFIKSLKMFCFNLTKAFNFPFVLYSYNAKATFFQPYPNEMLS